MTMLQKDAIDVDKLGYRHDSTVSAITRTVCALHALYVIPPQSCSGQLEPPREREAGSGLSENSRVRSNNRLITLPNRSSLGPRHLLHTAALQS